MIDFQNQIQAFTTSQYLQTKSITKLFSTRTSSSRRGRSSGNSAASFTVAKPINKNLIILGIAGGVTENLLQEYISGTFPANYQYSNVIFFMNRLPFSTSLLDKLPSLSLAKQKITIVTLDPSNPAAGIDGLKVISNDPQSRQGLSQIPFFSGSSERKQEDIIVSIDDINEYERLKFIREQQASSGNDRDANNQPRAPPATFTQTDREYLNRVSSLVSTSLKSSATSSNHYFILQQRGESAAENTSPLTRLSTVTKSLLDQQRTAYSILQYNELVGGIPDFKPLPFSSLPQAEPELEISSKLQSLVVSPYNTKPSRAAIIQKKAASATASSTALSPNSLDEDVSVIPPDVCVRGGIVKFLFQYLDKEFLPITLNNDGSTPSPSPLKASITSIEGNPLTTKDYSRLFQRLRSFTARAPSDGNKVEVLSFDFKQILRLPQFMAWLEDTWYFNALLEIKASTIGVGPRPTRLRIVNNSTMQLDWVDISHKDLEVYTVGALTFDFILNNNSPTEAVEGEEVSTESKRRKKRGGRGGSSSIPDQLVISRVRFATPASQNKEKEDTSNELTAETLLLERLIEGINKNAYKKMFCLPLDEDDVNADED